MSHYIGTAGYVYPHWRKGAFYPLGLSQANELTHYVSNFPSVEINATWHAFPRLKTLLKWSFAAHRYTTFALKAPAIITHQKKLRNAEQDIHAFIKLAKEGLSDHLGPILFQCPPSLPVSISLLEQFIQTVRAAAHHYGTFRVALEFRSPDWFCDPVYRLLAENDIALVNNIAVTDTDFSVLHDLFPHARNVNHPKASWCYNRFHGSKTIGVLTDFPDHILRQFTGTGNKGVQYSFFLNDWGAIAPKNAMKYASVCAEAGNIDVKTLFGGFVPQWTKSRPSIKSFFSPVSKKPAAEKVPREKSPTRSVSNVASKTGHSPVATVKAPIKVSKAPIQKRRAKRKVKDISSFFSSASDKG